MNQEEATAVMRRIQALQAELRYTKSNVKIIEIAQSLKDLNRQYNLFMGKLTG